MKPELYAKALQLRNTGLLQRQVADRIGVSQPTISRWLSGDRLARPIQGGDCISLGVFLDNSGPTMPQRWLWNLEEELETAGPVRAGTASGGDLSLDASFLFGFAELGETIGDSSLDPAEMVERGEIV